jgi:hypothetical protein
VEQESAEGESGVGRNADYRKLTAGPPQYLYGPGCFCIPQNAVATPLRLYENIELRSAIVRTSPNNVGE